ncbi:MAG: PEP/pyruvate-binding domain-containing protein [Thermoanaerobaculia bacterium]
MRHELFEPVWTEHGFGTRLQDFQQLMRHRIRDVLLVSSLFDLFLFEEEGLLYEQIEDEYQGLALTHIPEFTRVSSGTAALEAFQDEPHIDLVLATLHIEDMTPLRLARMIREKGFDVPIVLLAYDNQELNDLLTRQDISILDRIWVWQGDFRVLIAAVKDLEDRLNVERDTALFGVQCIVVIEDSIRYYSTLMPLLYSEVMRHSHRLIAEGVNSAHRSLRMRARPKLLLSTNWEEAWNYFQRYQQHIIGVISDVGFPRDGEMDERAGLDFAKAVRSRWFDIAILLQSTTDEFEQEARDTGNIFISKSSPTVVEDLRRILHDTFSFGDFIFRTPDGKEVGRATDLRSLEEQLRVVPDESLLYHAERNHFSNWLKARTEFRLAYHLRPRKVTDYDSADDLRGDVIDQLHEHRSIRQRGMLAEFSRDTFDPSSSFARIGGGSLGGKARGLAFVNALLSSYMVRNRFPDVEIEVPPAVVVGTDAFDEFVERNDLYRFALECGDDLAIMQRFVDAPWFPPSVEEALAGFLDLCREPLAVRSSSLLEDSQFHPFAGVYQTYMLPNSHPDPRERLRELTLAIRRVYASTFYHAAREYIKVTSLRVEDEKMAVMVQKIAGARHGDRFYPEVSGVARSYNFYPVGPQRPEDGVASVALGLGRMIVEGGPTVRFCPRYPDHLQQFFSARDTLRHNQREFYALEMSDEVPVPRSVNDERVRSFPLELAEKDGTLQSVASTYSAENDALYEGVSRAGMRVVTFAPILRSHLVPLPQALEFLCELGSWGMGNPIEIEMAMNLSVPPDERKKLAVLQMRPLVLNLESEELEIGEVPIERLLCASGQVLGHGAIHEIRDVVVVDFGTFDRARSREAAAEVARVNDRLIEEGRAYLLIGPGRWGTLDPWLGVPVKWDQICGARAIIEAGLRDVSVDPSQGSHFFQNLTSFQIGYFTVSERHPGSFVDWEWLSEQRAFFESGCVRHLRFDEPVMVKMNGHQRRGVVYKP